jgi:hypothetical protein
MRHAMVLAVLVLAGCGYDRPPREFRPASRDCGSLAGDFVVDETDLRWLAPKHTLPTGVTFPFLNIQDRGNGILVLELRRRTSDVLAEAATLRITHPDAYRAWRAAALGEPADPQQWNVRSANPGPVLLHRWEMSTGDCRAGWSGGSAGVDITPRPGSDDTEHLAFVSLARDDAGSLLVQHHVRSRRSTGMSFRGQELRWYGYAYSDWHRIVATPAGSASAALTAADLPDVPDRSTRMALEHAREAQWGRFQYWLRDQLPPDTRLTVFRERQMDPEAMNLPLGQSRIEIAGHWPPGQPDPITPLLQGLPEVSDIEVKQSRLQPDNRPYVLLEFTLTATRGAR